MKLTYKQQHEKAVKQVVALIADKNVDLTIVLSVLIMGVSTGIERKEKALEAHIKKTPTPDAKAYLKDIRRWLKLLCEMERFFTRRCNDLICEETRAGERK